MSNKVYFKTILQDTIQITPKDLNKNIDQILLLNLRKKVEGKCIKNGYIKKDSIKIINRSTGYMNPAHFNGNVSYKVKYYAEICNPPINVIVICKISSINKMGITAYIEDKEVSPLNIMLANQHHLGNKEFFELQVGMFIKAQITAKDFGYNDDKILAIAIFKGVAEEGEDINEDDYANNNINNDNINNDNINNDNINNDNSDISVDIDTNIDQ